MKIKSGEKRLVEFRTVNNDEGKMLIEGYAVTYNTPATHTYGERRFTEIIKAGALDFTDMSDVPMRYNHNDTFCIMARTRNNSLKLIKDDVGLKVSAELIDTQSNRDIYKAICEGLIDKMSFAFTVSPDGDQWDCSKDETVRTINKIDRLYDVSVVDTPFYGSTSIYARSFELLDNNMELKRLEGFEMRKRKILLTHCITPYFKAFF